METLRHAFQYSDAVFDFTAEMLSATNVQQYDDPSDSLNALRIKSKAVGISLSARLSGVSRSQIKVFVNQGKTPREATSKKLKAMLQENADRRPGANRARPR